jgi:hypothetical protein
MAATLKTYDYTGRTVDVAAFDGAYSDSEFELAQGIMGAGYKSGKVVTGIQKLVQRWVIEFLTPVGSMPYLLDRGSIFLNSARSGRLRTEADVVSLFAFCNSKISDNLLREDLLGVYPEDEQYSDAKLISVAVSVGSKVSLTIAINSKAGADRIFTVPIQIVPAR